MEGWIVIDRIENGIAACEIDGQGMRMLPLSLLPEGAQPGDCLHKVGSGYQIDREETRRRKEYNAAMLERLLRRKEEE